MTDGPTTGVRLVPFDYVLDTFISVPMTVNGSVEGNFILDTGIGVNLLSRSLGEELGCIPTHEHVGQRMSGQELTIPITQVRSLTIGEATRNDIAVGLYDIESLMPGQNIIGFIGLDYSEAVPFTIDYRRKGITTESADSLKEIIARGYSTPVALDRKGDALSVMMKMVLPSREEICVEVDTGSLALILHKKYMAAMKIREGDPGVMRKDGKDETGHSYSRYFAQLSGDIHVRGLPEVKERSPHVMFQEIIYDGLVGHNFLSRYSVTYDLPRAQIIFTETG